jgi:phospholipid/cholesterol/gamma-HCH transport system permease protein
VTAIADAPRLLRRGAAALGYGVRQRTRFLLMLAALALGVIVEGVRPSAWRRTARAELSLALHQAVSGGLATTLVTAALIGFAMVSQAIYWLGTAGQEELIGPVLVTVLVRELTPVLSGLIVFGRNGTVTVAELGALQIGGQVRALEAQGVDSFAVLVLPRAVAFAIACFTLGVLFVLTALLTGFFADRLLSAARMSLPSFLDNVLHAMNTGDFAVFPAKTLGIGLLVALVACLTGLTAGARSNPASLLPQAFVRGVLAILLTSLLLSLAV